MQCLDPDNTSPSAQSLDALINDVRAHGRARFFYSRRFDEWIMLVPNCKAKRAVHEYYGQGTAVYTLDEIAHIQSLPAQARPEIHKLVREFQSFVSEVKK